MTDGRSGTAPLPSHAGGVVYRRRNARLEFLLVRSKDRTARVLPKGHVDPGELPAEAAAREVLEEAGYALASGTPLGVFVYWARGRRIATAYYLMEADGAQPDQPQEAFRKPRWFAIDEIAAADLPVPEGVRAILERARDTIESTA